MMTIMPGHEDLQPREVVGFTADGYAIVPNGEGNKRYKVFMMPGGNFVGRPEAAPASVDQLAIANRPAMRWSGVDQA
jgi:hypothetical protein